MQYTSIPYSLEIYFLKEFNFQANDLKQCNVIFFFIKDELYVYVICLKELEYKAKYIR